MLKQTLELRIGGTATFIRYENICETDFDKFFSSVRDRSICINHLVGVVELILSIVIQIVSIMLIFDLGVFLGGGCCHNSLDL